MTVRPVLVALASLSLAHVASAQVLQEKNISLSLAAEIAQHAVQQCGADHYNVTAAVVDRGGNLRALLRADNAGPHTVDAARRKAFTSVSMRIPTSKLVENLQKNPAAAQLASVEGFLALDGGVPIKAGGEVIGAIGVGGAPGGQFDEACAMKAIEAVQAKLK